MVSLIIAKLSVHMGWDSNPLPATAAATTLRKMALPKLTMISFLCSCMATCKMANSEKKARHTTVTMAQMPATRSHAARKQKRG